MRTEKLLLDGFRKIVSKMAAFSKTPLPMIFFNGIENQLLYVRAYIGNYADENIRDADTVFRVEYVPSFTDDSSFTLKLNSLVLTSSRSIILPISNIYEVYDELCDDDDLYDTLALKAFTKVTIETLEHLKQYQPIENLEIMLFVNCSSTTEVIVDDIDQIINRLRKLSKKEESGVYKVTVGFGLDEPARTRHSLVITAVD